MGGGGKGGGGGGHFAGGGGGEILWYNGAERQPDFQKFKIQ